MAVTALLMIEVGNDYVSVTEIAGDEVTQEQVDRLCNRYYWAGQYCAGKDVMVSCILTKMEITCN